MGSPLRVAATTATLAALAVAPAGAAATTFTNPAPITIPAGPADATPYPSEIAVSGIPGPISDVNVRINAFTHADPDDVAFVLVAPGSQALLLYDGAGDFTPVAGIDLILDDSAAAALPDSSPLTGGTFRPAAYYPSSNFGPPGPGISYGNPGPVSGGTATFASVFNGIEANGTWSLFARDFGPLNGGQFASGWSLEIQPSPSGPATSPTPTPTATKKKCKKGRKLKKGKCVKKKKRKRKKR